MIPVFICNDLEQVYNVLDEMIPLEGSVRNANKNRALERFRKATNVVYDIFNNGLCNKAKSLRVLGLRKDQLPLPYYAWGDYYEGQWDRIREIVEPIMEQIILDAAVEQNLHMELVPNSVSGQFELQVAS